MAHDPQHQLLDDLQKAAADAIEEYNADIAFYAGPLDYPGDYVFIEEIGSKRKRDNVLFFLSTYGGSADVAFRMMRALQRAYQKGTISLVVTLPCKSAGTLAALGADEVVISDTGELGPIDVQLRKLDELGERTSGLTALQALSALRDEAFSSFEQHFLELRQRSGAQITTKTAAEIATKLTVGWFQPMYEQIDPMRLGENQRALSVAREYGKRLAERGNVERDAMDQLIRGYASHEFIIDREEACTLFSKVRAPSASEMKVAREFAMKGLTGDGLNGDEPIILMISRDRKGPQHATDSTKNTESGRKSKSHRPRAQQDAPAETNGEIVPTGGKTRQ